MYAFIKKYGALITWMVKQFLKFDADVEWCVSINRHRCPVFQTLTLLLRNNFSMSTITCLDVLSTKICFNTRINHYCVLIYLLILMISCRRKRHLLFPSLEVLSVTNDSSLSVIRKVINSSSLLASPSINISFYEVKQIVQNSYQYTTFFQHFSVN